MSKGKGLTFTVFAILGAVAGYATYMASKNEFSDETKENYDKVVNKFKNVSTDIKRTYTAIGDKTAFKKSTKDLGVSTKKLAKKASGLVASASSDMYKFAKEKIKNAVNNSNNDDKNNNYDDIDNGFSSKKNKIIKKIKKSPASAKPKSKNIK